MYPVLIMATRSPPPGASSRWLCTAKSLRPFSGFVALSAKADGPDLPHTHSMPWNTCGVQELHSELAVSLFNILEFRNFMS
jgi:hypothetical protein